MSNYDSRNFESDPSDANVGVEIRGLRKVFGDKVAVAGTHLKMYQGQIMALLGHNGAVNTVFRDHCLMPCRAKQPQ